MSRRVTHFKNSNLSYVGTNKTRSILNERRKTQAMSTSLQIFQEDLDLLLSRAQTSKQKMKQLQISKVQMHKSLQMSLIQNQMDKIKQKVKTIKKANNISETISFMEKQLDKSKKIQRNNEQFLPRINPNHQFYQMPNYQHPYIPPRFNTVQPQQQQQYYSSEKPLINYKNKSKSKKQRQLQRAFKRKQTIKRLKKVFYAVSFIILFKNYSKKVKDKKKQLFSKFWPMQFTNYTSSIRKICAQSSKKFFIMMIKKEDAQLIIQQDDTQKIKTQKLLTTKTLLKTLIYGLEDAINSPVFNKVIPALYLFCKHGSYVDNGVLTRQQIQTVSISQQNQYLRMNANLQKSQIINLFFMKIILYNIILQPWKLEPAQLDRNKQILMQNFYLIGSLLYDMLLKLQDEYLNNLEKIYSIGNWHKIRNNIKCSQSLIYPGKSYQQGQMISGLLNQHELELLTPEKSWRQQKILLKNLINRIYERIIEYHKDFIHDTLMQKKKKQLIYKSI